MSGEVVQINFSLSIPSDKWLSKFSISYPQLQFNLISMLPLSANQGNALLQVKGLNLDQFWDEFSLLQNKIKFNLIFQDKKVNLPTFLNLFSNIIPLGLGQMEEEFKKIAGTKVKDLIQANPQTITNNTTVEEIATLMSENKTYYLPVIEQGKVIGVVTKRDLIKAVAKGKIW